MRIRMPANKWCVYGHYIGNELIYIGSGNRHRPFSDLRTHKWHSHVGADDYEIEIFGEYFSREEALSAELLLIKKHTPVCNSRHTGQSRSFKEPIKLKIAEGARRSWASGMRKLSSGLAPAQQIKCVEHGVIYKSMRDASVKTGISVGAISMAVNGHRKSAGGLHFTRDV